MKTFAARRQKNIVLLLIAIAAILLLHLLWSIALDPTELLSGWTLAAMVVFLSLYNLRKKLSVIPLFTSAGWLQFHIYIGLLSSVVFLTHISYRIPNGMFEGMLAVLYLTVFFSGVIGLIMSRTIPSRITARGEEVLYERIPIHLKTLREKVEGLVFGCISETDTTGIPTFYLQYLQPFFERPCNFWRHLVHSQRPRRELLIELDSHRRFLNDKERDVLEEIADLIRRKDDLDYQYSLQTLMKYWLFVHVPLTYALLTFMIFHVLVVYAFLGRPA